jgi:hypothetical protein
MSTLVDWEIRRHRAAEGTGGHSPGPYLEPPTVPEGMTLDEYRRARPPRPQPLPAHLLGRLRHLAGVRPEPRCRPAAISFHGI